MQLIIHILQLFGSITLFIFAIKFLSENLQALSGSNFKRTLNQITSNNFSSVLSGTIFTVAIQSSSAASVFILGFVNAGLINLRKAFGLILGANLGTTLTLWLIYFGLKFDFLMIALPIFFIAFPFYLSKKWQHRKWSSIFLALSFLFISIYFLKLFIPSFDHVGIQNLVLNLKNFGLLTHLCFILVGILLTVIFHFSSATIAITMLLTQKGLPIDLAAMIILGANIGTTITAHLVAAIGNQKTKAVAMFHTLFNVLSALIFMFFASSILNLLQQFSSNQNIILIAFDFLTNFVMLLMVFPFINKITSIFQKNLNFYNQKRTNKVEFFSIPFGTNSDLYRNEVNKKMIRLAGTTRQIVHTLGRMITESDEEKMTIFRERIYQLEKDGDDLEQEVKDFLQDIAELDLPNENRFELHQLIMLGNQMESVGDIAIKIASTHRKRRLTNSYFTPKMREYLVSLQTNLDLATTILIQNLNNINFEISLKEAENVERTINQIFKEAEVNMYKTIEKDKLNTLGAIYYKDLIQFYEQLGDNLYRANETIIKLNRQ